MTEAQILRSRFIVGLVLIWLFCLAGLTVRRSAVFESELSLWSDAVVVSPQKPRPYINLGLAKERAGDIQGAFLAHQTALALAYQGRLTAYQQRFSRIASLTNLARMLAQNHEEEAALRMLNQVIAEAPLFPHSRLNRGVLLARMGRCEEAEPDWAIAVKLEPGWTLPRCR